MKKRISIVKWVRRVMGRLLSGDKHVWGWVTLDVSNPIPTAEDHCAAV